MKSHLYKMMAGATALMAFIPSLNAQPISTQNGLVTAPDAGASFVLLAIGCSGLAIAARKRFKR